MCGEGVMEGAGACAPCRGGHVRFALLAFRKTRTFESEGFFTCALRRCCCLVHCHMFLAHLVLSMMSVGSLEGLQFSPWVGEETVTDDVLGLWFSRSARSDQCSNYGLRVVAPTVACDQACPDFPYAPSKVTSTHSPKRISGCRMTVSDVQQTVVCC